MPAYLRSIEYRFESHQLPSQLRMHLIGYLGYLYEYYFTRLHTTENIFRLIVWFANEEKNKKVPYNIGYVGNVYQSLCVDDMSSLDDRMYQRYFLDRFQEAILYTAQLYNWSTENFDSAYQRILDNNFEFRDYWGKVYKSPDKQWKARIYFEHDWQRGTYVRFENTKTAQVFVHRFEASGWIALFKGIGNCFWKSNELFCVYLYNQRDYWDITVNGQVEFHYPTAERGEVHGQYNLGKIYMEGDMLDNDLTKAKYWIEKAASQNFERAVWLLEKWDSMNK